jgi:hypothetical protein
MTDEVIRIEDEPMHKADDGSGRKWTEEVTVASDQVVGKVQELLKEAAVRKITIKDDNGKKLLSIPLYAGVAGLLVFGPWSALALIAAWFAKVSILIERETPVADSIKVNTEAEDES